MDVESQTEFTLALRIPGWCRNYNLQINGTTLNMGLVEKGYVKIKRQWQKGDHIELWLEMPIELIQAHPKVRADIGKVAIQRGPIVYCLEEIDNGKNLWDVTLAKDAKLTMELSEEFGEVPVIKGKVFRSDNSQWGNALYRPAQEQPKSVDIKAVPYYFWGNRKPGEMLVWIPRR